MLNNYSCFRRNLPLPWVKIVKDFHETMVSREGQSSEPLENGLGIG